MRNSTFCEVFRREESVGVRLKNKFKGTRLGAVLLNFKDSKRERIDLTLQGSG